MIIRKSAVVAVMLIALFLLSCGMSDPFSGKWFNDVIEKEMLTITKSGSAYKVDTALGSFLYQRGGPVEMSNGNRRYDAPD